MYTHKVAGLHVAVGERQTDMHVHIQTAGQEREMVTSYRWREREREKCAPLQKDRYAQKLQVERHAHKLQMKRLSRSHAEGGKTC